VFLGIVHQHYEAVLPTHGVDAVAAPRLAGFALGIVAGAFNLIRAADGTSTLNPMRTILRRQ